MVQALIHMERKTIQSANAPAPVGAYSQAVQLTSAAELVFVSGQLGMNPETGELVSGGVEAEAACAMKNLGAILESAGMSMANIVRATLYLKNMGDFAKVNAIYAAQFDGEFPARVAIEVAALPKNALFEIDAIAAR